MLSENVKISICDIILTQIHHFDKFIHKSLPVVKINLGTDQCLRLVGMKEFGGGEGMQDVFPRRECKFSL